MAKETPAKLTVGDYERIGQDLELVVATGYAHKRRLFGASLLKGLATGIGSVLGATIMLLVLLWLLTLLGKTPIIGEFFDDIRNTISNNKQEL